MIPEKKVLVRFKSLVDQITGQVVWLTFYQESEVPVFDATLNYYKYNGYTDVKVWNNYLTYELYLTEGGTNLHVKPRGEIDPRIQLLRAKAISFDYISVMTSVHYDRQGFTPSSIYRQLVNEPITMDSRWVRATAEAHDCDMDSAFKLLNFKIDEYKNTQFVLESARMKFAHEIRSANTLPDVCDVYNKYTSLYFNINRKELTELEAVMGQLYFRPT